jgi:hypothetical protein
VLSFARLTFLLFLKRLGRINSNNLSVGVESAVGACALGELLAFVHGGISFPVLFEDLFVVEFGLVKLVAHVFPLASKVSSLADLALLRRISLDVTRARDNGSIFVFEVLFNLFSFAHVLVRCVVIVVLLHGLSRFERNFVASLEVAVLFGIAQNGSYRFIEGAA